ncbi:MAG TPA: OmpA family protein [Steroidobacteraceae bacterium]
MKKIMFVGALAVLVAACASAPPRSEQLEQARAAVETLSQDPLAQQAAQDDLHSARNSLQQAQTALQQKQPPAIVDHFAYLAQRQAEAGEARCAEARARAEVARSQQERDQILLDARTREARNAQMQSQTLQQQAANAREQAANAREQAANAQNAAQATQAQLDAAQQQLAELKAKETQRGLVVTLGDVLFDTGQATLKPGADLQLSRLATYLNSNPHTKILIEGHTDSRGSDDYNQALSDRRAEAVKSALVSRGVSADQVEAAGRGKAYPVATNDTPAGRQQNRRVEIIFSDPAGRFAQGAEQGAQPVQR